MSTQWHPVFKRKKQLEKVFSTHYNWRLHFAHLLWAEEVKLYVINVFSQVLTAVRYLL